MTMPTDKRSMRIGDLKRGLPSDVSLASHLRCEALAYAQQQRRAA